MRRKDSVAQSIYTLVAVLYVILTFRELQIEFCFRDAKQFVGLTDSQARDTRKLDFAFNSSFTAVNVAKIMCSEYNLSIWRLKALIINAYYAQRIIDVFENNPNTQLNHEIVNEIFGFAADAA